MQELNLEQLRAVNTTEGPLLIIAGAGSGKTKVISSRINKLLDLGVNTRNILALTFTNKAAREMHSRVSLSAGKELSKKLTISTFHSFGVYLLRREIKALGYCDNFSIYDDSDRISCIREAAQELKTKLEPGELQGIAELFSKKKTRQVELAGEYANLLPLYSEYQKHLKVYNAVDFDDLITLPIQLLADTKLCEKYRKRFQYILVDEFQDTSLIQYELLRLLALEHRNICCVGDDDQSIYSWRGANFANIRLFEKDFPELQELLLEKNYRSTDTILKAANAVISNNHNRKNKQLSAALQQKEMAIQVWFPEDEHDEAKQISNKILSMRAEEGRSNQQFGILVRTNTITKYIENDLLEMNIPYKVSGGTSFFQREEIKDIVSYLRVIVNNDDDINLLRIINKPRRGMGRVNIAELSLEASRQRMSLYKTAKNICFSLDAAKTNGLQSACADLIYLLEEFSPQFMEQGKLAETLNSFVEDLAYWNYLLQKFSNNTELAKRKYDNIKILIKMLERWESDGTRRGLKNWLNRITLLNNDNWDEREDDTKVNIMTIHAAKGLEFEVVFLTGLEEGILPHYRVLEELDNDLEEERRLFYVAITRAKQRLFMTSCKQRSIRGTSRDCIPSPFLQEIPKELQDQSLDETRSEDELISAMFERLPWNK